MMTVWETAVAMLVMQEWSPGDQRPREIRTMAPHPGSHWRADGRVQAPMRQLACVPDAEQWPGRCRHLELWAPVLVLVAGSA
jgi:hypothetical protein